MPKQVEGWQNWRLVLITPGRRGLAPTAGSRAAGPIGARGRLSARDSHYVGHGSCPLTVPDLAALVASTMSYQHPAGSMPGSTRSTLLLPCHPKPPFPADFRGRHCLI